ncbi:hypothetical protein ACE1ET_09845 [Saccharicrinis sp. FJH62]|uniref:hypothetical protein n=1 Tax=Saccharicrinis sp. FJH62 TaxID=3344657 RepID=UPI0035D4A33E
MLRRILYFLSVILLALVIILFYRRLNEKPVKELDNHMFQAIPSDAAFIITSESMISFISELETQNLVWKDLIKTPMIGKISKSLTVLDSLLSSKSELKAGLDNSEIAVSYQVTGKDDVVPLVVIPVLAKISSANMKSFINNNSQGTRTDKKYDNITIYNFIDSSGYSGYYVYDNYLVWSSSEIALERSAREFQNKAGVTIKKGFNEIFATRGSNALATVFINTDELMSMLKPVASKPLVNKLEQIAGDNSWFGVDVSLQSNLLSFMGFYSINNSNYVSAFKGQKPSEINILDVVPVGAQQFSVANISDLNLFRSNYKKYLEAQNKLEAYNIWINKTGDLLGQNPELFADDFFSGEFLKVTYAGYTNNKRNSYLIAKVKGNSLAENALNGKIKYYAEKERKKPKAFIDELRIDKDLQYICYDFDLSEMIGILYGNILKSDDLHFWALYDNYLFAAPSKKVLKDIIYANVLGKTLPRQSYFDDFYHNLSISYNLLFYQDSRSIPLTSKDSWSESFYKSLPGNNDVFSNLNGIGFQVDASGKFPYVNMIMDYSGQQKSDAETIWQSLLDTSFIMKPALVLNHYTKENEIFVQDLKHTIYLINPSGRILWKKSLGEPIISEIYQVDSYKNGKLQLLFNTATRLIMLDRNGNYVERYPVKLPSGATTGLGLADYDNSRNYRIFIPVKDRRILLYSVDGNRVKGWNFGKTDHEVLRPVQHIRFGKRDYILCADRNRVYILDRQGKERVTLSDQFSKNENVDFYPLAKGPGGAEAILTGDTQGNLVTIMMSGVVNKRKLPLKTQTYQMVVENIDGSGGTEIITVEGTSMKVFDYTGNLLFERVFPNNITDCPNIYKFSARDYKIGIVDRIQQNIYLFNNDGSEKSGFPLTGNTPFSIGFLKSSGSFNLIVGGRDNYIYNYIVK